MSSDFTLNKYRELCQAAIDSRYALLTVKAYLTVQDQPAKLIILRHDIDRKLENAVRMAEIEKELGIKATYYFRFNKSVFQPNLIKEIASMGHEIGYHYEALDKTKGDYIKAIQLFEHELEELRKVAEVNTICMHGNPLTRWDNRDLWTKYDFRNFGIVGEAYLSFDNITYLSDTGRTWGAKYKVKDWLVSGTHNGSEITNNTEVNSTDDVIKLIEKGQLGYAYLLIHPERWSDSLIGWTIDLTLDTAVNMVKRILISMRR